MATVREVVYTDDYTGEQLANGARRTVSLAVDGRAYELDLSEKSRQVLLDALAPFIENALSEKLPTRPAHRIALSSPRRPAKVDREQSRAMRAWWRDNWKAAELDPPSDKGRIPDAVMEAYHRHGGAAVPQPTPPPGRSRGKRATKS